MDLIIHSVANATPNRCLKSTPSLTHTAQSLLMTRGTHLVSKYLLGGLISTICTKTMFILTIWISILENQTVSPTTAKTPEPNLKPRGHKPNIQRSRIHHLRNRLPHLNVPPQTPDLPSHSH